MGLKIEDGKCSFIVDKRIYNIPVVMKTAYMFVDNSYISFDLPTENDILVTMIPKSKSFDMNTAYKEFCNELLFQNIRYEIYKETKDIRKIILGRALYSTCIEDDSHHAPESEHNSGYLLDEIAQDWFKNGD